MKPSAEALAFAERQRFGDFVSSETIIAAYEAHLRILAKVAARKAGN